MMSAIVCLWCVCVCGKPSVMVMNVCVYMRRKCNIYEGNKFHFITRIKCVM